MSRKEIKSIIVNDRRLWPEQVIGGKYLKLLQKHLEGLRGEVPGHGNQSLYLDDVFVAYLLAFFNPAIRSLRIVEDFSQTVQTQKHLSIPKLCRSTLSDFNQLADASRLEPILASLRETLAQEQKPRAGGDLAELLKMTVAVDGTFLAAAADVTWALCCANQGPSKKHRARLDCHLNVSSWIPEVVALPGSDTSESDSAIEHLQDGKIYLYDRGFSGFSLLNAHYREVGENLEARSHFVVRYKVAGSNSPELVEAQEQPLTEADRSQGIVSDRIGRFRSSNAQRHPIRDVPLREVIIHATDRDGKPHTIRLITNLLDVPAQVIGQLHQNRWQVELFFRWLKCYANFDHLISHSREAVLLHFYVTLIGVMLMYLHTGSRPSKYLFALMSQVAAGAELDDILPILKERERQCEVARKSAAARSAKKKLAQS